MRNPRILLAIASVAILAGCSEFQAEVDKKFGDQNFKTAIALIELHKIRFGQYPEKLADIRFAGDWDPIHLNSVEYKKLPNGYELNVVRGWIGRPELRYPPDFWRGLGIVKSNVIREE